MHYVTAGSGAPLLLLHGVPKTSFYWHRIIPLLTPHFTIIAPDIRGFGDSAKPHGGYDMKTIAEDLVQLMSALGHDTFSVAGEDWAAAFAYALAASNRDRVKKLSFGEMLLPGFGIEKWSFLNEENVNSTHWSWHVNFFYLHDVPEMLIQGREEIFWSTWMKNEMFDPSSISEEAVAEWVRCASTPGGLRGIFEVYRAHFENAKQTVHAMIGPLALELAPVRINCGAAWLTRTNFWSKLGMSDEVQAAMSADGKRSIPLRHVAAPEEITHALLFAATNPYTTGTILDPNGGLHLGRVSARPEEPSFGSVRGMANNR